ncbi:MAG: type II toxin-antitoxin system RelE/ParE family toxin [Firmicutes bacterium]|nr:type II toxin-antitoxin system RelE/ParE family toxin [Bacillota bacterium]
MTVDYSPMAITDLVRIGADVLDASKSEAITRNYIDGLIGTIEAKALFPRSGAPLYYGDLFTGYYSVRYKEYIAFYQVDKDKLHVDRVLYARSDYMRTLFKE